MSELLFDWAIGTRLPGLHRGGLTEVVPGLNSEEVGLAVVAEIVKRMDWA